MNTTTSSAITESITSVDTSEKDVSTMNSDGTNSASSTINTSVTPHDSALTSNMDVSYLGTMTSPPNTFDNTIDHNSQTLAMDSSPFRISSSTIGANIVDRASTATSTEVTTAMTTTMEMMNIESSNDVTDDMKSSIPIASDYPTLTMALDMVTSTLDIKNLKSVSSMVESSALDSVTTAGTTELYTSSLTTETDNRTYLETTVLGTSEAMQEMTSPLESTLVSSSAQESTIGTHIPTNIRDTDDPTTAPFSMSESTVNADFPVDSTTVSRMLGSTTNTVVTSPSDTHLSVNITLEVVTSTPDTNHRIDISSTKDSSTYDVSTTASKISALPMSMDFSVHAPTVTQIPSSNISSDTDIASTQEAVSMSSDAKGSTSDVGHLTDFAHNTDTSTSDDTSGAMPKVTSLLESTIIDGRSQESTIETDIPSDIHSTPKSATFITFTTASQIGESTTESKIDTTGRDNPTSTIDIDRSQSASSTDTTVAKDFVNTSSTRATFPSSSNTVSDGIDTVAGIVETITSSDTHLEGEGVQSTASFDTSNVALVVTSTLTPGDGRQNPSTQTSLKSALSSSASELGVLTTSFMAPYPIGR